MEPDDLPWLEGIQGEQARELIQSDASVIRVVAGPGSGKTTCLKRRTRRLIEGDGIDPESVFVGTFTRVIANELQEELGSDIRVQTLHSLARELLSANPAACQGMNLRFLLKYEEDSLLYDVADSYESSDIYGRRNELRLLQAHRASRMEYQHAKFSGAVRLWLQRHRAMLIGEVVFLCVSGLENEDITPGIFDHVVIDEYQDLTAAEQELVWLIWSCAGSLTVMGDNNQSIYGFRHNHPDGIEGFLDKWTDSDIRDLTFLENRRCGDDILVAANLMMAEAGSGSPPMIASSGRIGDLTSLHWPTVDDEVEGLSILMRERDNESFLVLVPRRFIGYRIAEAIGDEAQTYFTEEVLEHPIAQEAFAAASILAEPDDPVACRAWLGFHGTSSRMATNRNSDAYRSVELDTAGEGLVRGIVDGTLVVTGKGKMQVLQRARRAVDLWEENLLPQETIEQVFCDSAARAEPDPEKRRWLLQDLKELRDAAVEILSSQEQPSLQTTLSVLRYRIATRAPLRESPSSAARVKIMTLHSAKGIEADNVVIAGVSDQIMPGLDKEQSVISEQRRLLYVAMTRARDSLLVSWSRGILYRDARNNRVRIDTDMWTEDGSKWVAMARSSLLPQGLAGGQSGRVFIEEMRERTSRG
ncbi:MAG: ATP-dependent helicase [Acidimicrobiia bacterium]|nr:ATP-dependent helicase [Acidimicrobiia bacterium]MYC43954.1 ATP-dependent helicase [Acidimicrobiia bacterium]MYI20345.1 ATP-dependent helicase [Acidimicrobiia bacterium]